MIYPEMLAARDIVDAVNELDSSVVGICRRSIGPVGNQNARKGRNPERSFA